MYRYNLNEIVFPANMEQWRRGGGGGGGHQCT
jgi:hypothetical protein